jgi:uncharacterized protein (TIGR02453 family)
MAAAEPIFTLETFRFFLDLARHNQKTWMDANRERYQERVVQPFRRLLEATAQAVLQLDAGFEPRFSRINRDIRFAKDKTPYRPQMYLEFRSPFAGEGEAGQFYIGLSAKTATAGFRIYGGSKRKESALAQIGDARMEAKPKWLAQQKKRLGRRYESYWYSATKGEWTKHDGWPVTAEDWKRVHGWIVRRKLAPAAATRASFPRDAARIFRDLYPLLQFTSLRD